MQLVAPDGTVLGNATTNSNGTFTMDLSSVYPNANLSVVDPSSNSTLLGTILTDATGSGEGFIPIPPIPLGTCFRYPPLVQYGSLQNQTSQVTSPPRVGIFTLTSTNNDG